MLSVEIFSLGMYQRIGPILRLLADRLGTKHFRVNVDERIALAEDFPGRPVASEKLPPRVTIREDEVRYRVRFEGAHKTGFFCDQRDNRRDLARFCPDRTVLDLCCYTGGFGLSALIRGKAREVTCVDLDEKAIAQAKENANLNQVKPSFVHADAFNYLRTMGQNAREYGVVVLDPPKLIPGRLDISAGKRKYFDLNVLAMKVVEPGGLLLSCSCSGLLAAEEFLILLRAAARQAGRSARVLAVTGASADHPVGLDALEGAYLKAVWLQMGERRAPSTAMDDEPMTSRANRRKIGIGREVTEAESTVWPSPRLSRPERARPARAQPDGRELREDDLPPLGRQAGGRGRGHGRAGAGARRLAGHRHGHAQDALAGRPVDLHAL